MPELLTYSTAEAAAIIPCKERWLLDQLRAGRFPGRKISREWRMTRDDIDRAIEISSVATRLHPIDTLAPESRRRIKQAP